MQSALSFPLENFLFLRLFYAHWPPLSPITNSRPETSCYTVQAPHHLRIGDPDSSHRNRHIVRLQHFSMRPRCGITQRHSYHQSGTADPKSATTQSHDFNAFRRIRAVATTTTSAISPSIRCSLLPATSRITFFLHQTSDVGLILYGQTSLDVYCFASRSLVAGRILWGDSHVDNHDDVHHQHGDHRACHVLLFSN
jgi:hypothetical protein